jgi:hypothetical protein
MFVERKVRYTALFTYLVGWHAGAVSFSPSDIILAHLACPLSDAMLCLHSGITKLSLYKYHKLFWPELSTLSKAVLLEAAWKEHVMLAASSKIENF